MESFGRSAETHAINLSFVGYKFSYPDGTGVKAGLSLSYDMTSKLSTVQWEGKKGLQEENMKRIVADHKPTFEQLAPTDPLWTPDAKQHVAPGKKRRVAASAASVQMHEEPLEFQYVVPKPKKERRRSNTIDEKLIECPITRQVMTDPVLCDDGYFYEREAIEQWFQHHRTSPMTRQPIRGTLKESLTMKSIIEAWRVAHK